RNATAAGSSSTTCAGASPRTIAQKAHAAIRVSLAGRDLLARVLLEHGPAVPHRAVLAAGAPHQPARAARVLGVLGLRHHVLRAVVGHPEREGLEPRAEDRLRAGRLELLQRC